ncbi:MAG: translation elongation factor Ts [Pseudomonadota bacterium]
MTISASLVKALRERTGAGMMECKKALVETGGDIEAAIELMRKSGQAKAARKAGRIAAEGLVVIKLSGDNSEAAMVEVNSETDFVAKDDNFASFADAVAACVLNADVAEVEQLMQLPLHEGEETTIEAAREALVAKIGENISVRRFVRVHTSGQVGSYRHGSRIGVLVDIQGGDAGLSRDVAMHIAASSPLCVSEDDVPADKLDKEREIFRAQALESGKPENIVDKIIEGRVRKYLEEVTLTGQAFVKDPDTRVGKLLSKAGATVVGFHRFEVGEGIEKKQEDFAAEVMAQARNA